MPTTMLIIDDSQVSRMMLRAIINSEQPEWDVLEAANADEALQRAKDNDIDVITLDMNMPGTDGLTVAPELQLSCPQAKIALLTANIQSAVKDKAEGLGLIFIAKPITEEKIIGFINQSVH